MSTVTSGTPSLSFAILTFTLVLTLLSGTVLCAVDVRIASITDFTNFMTDLNYGSNYKDATIFLDTDLDFTSYSTPMPIGSSTTYHFKGTFDGQGHIIQNFKISSSSYQYIGLFGYSTGTTIRNVVIDSFSSFKSDTSATSAYSGETYIGGVMGYCKSSNKPCIIENTVNMGDVSFTGNLNGNKLHLGGIAGYLEYSSYKVTLMNCANYGTVLQSGSVTAETNIGGIVGYSSGKSSNTITIQNCLNYGALSRTTSGTTVRMGGIVGYGTCSVIENCVSAGTISTTTSTSTSSDSIGSIVGDSSLTNLIHSFWTSSTGYNDACGSETTTSVSNSSLITLNTTTVSGLNEYAESNEDDKWSRWLFNENKNAVTFYINSTDNSISFTSQVILLPSTTVEAGYTFHWYKDSGKKNKFESVSVTSDTTLYGGVSNNYYTVTFDFDNETTLNETFQYGTEITYPDNSSIVMEGHTFNGWDKDITVMPSYNLTIKALWTAINYTVIFDLDNGTTLNETFQYNSEITYPDNSSIVMEGHTFNGWDTEITHMPSYNLTIKALWTEIPANSTEYVEIVFGTKDLEEEDIKIIISKYTNSSDFTIVSYETDDTTGSTKVIVKFNDKEQAEDFCRAVGKSKNKVIDSLSYVQEGFISLSMIFRPFTLFISFAMF